MTELRNELLDIIVRNKQKFYPDEQEVKEECSNENSAKLDLEFPMSVDYIKERIFHTDVDPKQLRSDKILKEVEEKLKEQKEKLIDSLHSFADVERKKIEDAYSLKLWQLISHYENVVHHKTNDVVSKSRYLYNSLNRTLRQNKSDLLKKVNKWSLSRKLSGYKTTDIILHKTKEEISLNKLYRNPAEIDIDPVESTESELRQEVEELKPNFIEDLVDSSCGDHRYVIVAPQNYVSPHFPSIDDETDSEESHQISIGINNTVEDIIDKVTGQAIGTKVMEE
ncbi:hypothetical protein SNEBB_001006 [Seison nebaliae]|nr:hypothetical protein SNEBB_001006 [Seison nebaliae]